MNPTHSERPKVLFLFSDTGGGHRSAAEAIIESLELMYPGKIETEMLDIFRAAPPPLGLAIPTYPAMARMPLLWGSGYKMSNGRRRAQFIHDAVWPYVRRAAHRIVSEHPADLIVSVHPVPNMAVTRAMTNKTPYIIVVTDMVSTHAMWYDRKADLMIVPTEEARQRGLHLGIDSDKMEIVGLPVADRFCHSLGTRAEMRKQLGWPVDLPMILMVSGGEGMGPLGRTAMAIDKANLPAGLAIVAGRNVKLRTKLEKRAIRSDCRRSRPRRRASSRAITRSETTAWTPSSSGSGRSTKGTPKRLPIRRSSLLSDGLTRVIAVPLAPARPVRPARWI